MDFNFPELFVLIGFAVIGLIIVLFGLLILTGVLTTGSSIGVAILDVFLSDCLHKYPYLLAFLL